MLTFILGKEPCNDESDSDYLTMKGATEEQHNIGQPNDPALLVNFIPVLQYFVSQSVSQSVGLFPHFLPQCTTKQPGNDSKLQIYLVEVLRSNVFREKQVNINTG